MAGLGLSIAQVAERRVEPFPLPGATVAADFANDRYWGGSLASFFTFTRASAKTDLLPNSPAGYAYRTFEANVPAITPGLGVLLEDSVTNLFLNSTAPVTQTITLPTSATYYMLWINDRVQEDGSATVSPGTAVISPTPAVGRDGAAGGLSATQGRWISFYCVTAGTVDVTIAGSPRTAQLETLSGSNLPRPTSFVVTGAAPVQRAADNLSLAGVALTALGAASGTLVMRSRSTLATGFIGSPLRMGSGAPFQQGVGLTQGQSADNQNVNNIEYTLGLGNRTACREALSWNPTERRVLANSGTLMTGSRLQAVATTFGRLGWNGTLGYLRGYVDRFDLFTTQVSDTQLRSFANVGDADIAMWGDSLTARAEWPGIESIPQYLGKLIGKRVLNAGVNGQTSTEIRARFIAEARFDREAIIMAGRNNYNSGTTVQADIAAMVAALPHNRYLVLSIANAALENEYVGTANYNNRVALNAALAATYGSRFLDVWQAMVDAYDPADPMEVQDFANKIVPWRFRQHLVVSTIIGNISDTATTFTTTGVSTGIIKVGSEYINVLTRSGTTVTNCVRGYAGSTPVAHSLGTRLESRENTHWSDAGRAFVAQQIANKRAALGW